MESFKVTTSIGMPLDKVNVDTDQIVPKQFLKSVQKTGFGKYLFFDWRYDKDQKPKSDFILNNPKYYGSKILLAKDNFGCGSSREHAVWALHDYGFRVVISTSFADIFYNNCFKNGILPIRLESKDVNELFEKNSEIEIDLANQTIKTKSSIIHFEIEDYRKKNLLQGNDEIDLTLQYENRISEYEKKSKLSFL